MLNAGLKADAPDDVAVEIDSRVEKLSGIMDRLGENGGTDCSRIALRRDLAMVNEAIDEIGWLIGQGIYFVKPEAEGTLCDFRDALRGLARAMNALLSQEEHAQ